MIQMEFDSPIVTSSTHRSRRQIGARCEVTRYRHRPTFELRAFAPSLGNSNRNNQTVQPTRAGDGVDLSGMNEMDCGWLDGRMDELGRVSGTAQVQGRGEEAPSGGPATCPVPNTSKTTPNLSGGPLVPVTDEKTG